MKGAEPYLFSSGVGEQQLPPAQPIPGLARRGQCAVCQRGPGQPQRWQ